MSTQVNGHYDITRRSFLAGAGVLGLSLGLVACGGPAGGSVADGSGSSASSASSADGGSASSASSDSSGSASPAAGKTLVAYFSGQGHTRRVAEELASDLGADIFEIVPAEPYSDDDLDYNDDSSRVVQEYQDESLQDVELEQDAPNGFADYDTVLVGYPIWWGDSAWAMRHFASNNDFTGKTVIPFCTSFSSGLGASGTNLADLAGTGDWQEGQRFSQDVDLGDVATWAAGLDV